MQYQGSAWGTNAAPGTEWSENGNHILQANGQTTTCFLFSAQLLGGGEILRLSGSGAGQSVDLVRLLYIIRLYLSLLFRRQAGIEYNYMLCIIASSYFFFWRKCSTVGAVGVQTSFFCHFAKSVTEKNNSRVDCAEAGKKTVQAPLRQAQRPTSSAIGEICWPGDKGWGFLPAGDCPAELSVIILQVTPNHYCLVKK